MSGLGRELRALPRRRPGIAAPAAALVLALLLSTITIALWTGDATGSSGDRTFMTVLTASFVGLAALLLALRARRMRQRMVVRICEGGLVRETRSARRDWPFAAIRKLEPAPNLAGGSALISTGHGLPLRLVPLFYDNVDDTLLPLLHDLWQGRPPPPPGPVAPGTAEVEFRPATRTRAGARGAPLLGPGRVAFDDDGMRFHGPRARTVLPEVLGAFVGVVGVVAAAIGLVALDVSLQDDGGQELAYVVAIGAGLLPGWLAYTVLRKRLRGRPVELQAPWSALRVFAVGIDDAELRLMDWDCRGDLRLLGRAPADRERLRNALAARLESAPTGGANDVLAAVLGGTR